MKLIGISQRVDTILTYQERRDSLDQRFSQLFAALDYLTVPLANHGPGDQMIAQLRLQAIVLSGGNSLAFLDANATDAAPERDQFEQDLLDSACQHQLPVVGICRGMQLINHYFGGQLSVVENHIATRHAIHWLHHDIKGAGQVNSYHQYGIAPHHLAPCLTPLAVDEQGFVEAFIHPERPILGIIWHPERETPFNALDLTLLQRVLP